MAKYQPVNTNKNPKTSDKPRMMFDYVSYVQNNSDSSKILTPEALQKKMTHEKERFTRLNKLIYLLLVTIPTYTDELEKCIQNLEKFGLKRENLGQLYKAISEFKEAESHYTKGEKALMDVWKVNESKENKQESEAFICNGYNMITDVIENAAKINSDGSFKKDFKNIIMLEHDKLKSLDKWWGQNGEGKLDVI